VATNSPVSCCRLVRQRLIVCALVLHGRVSPSRTAKQKAQNPAQLSRKKSFAPSDRDFESRAKRFTSSNLKQSNDLQQQLEIHLNAKLKNRRALHGFAFCGQ
jgi:hypothetical protein